ncbi:MAG: CoA transferase [Kordiimonadaceae bacterium]|nr:CoA transferase [Kordiimonadaceae bacterium]MBT6031836.1 CoA transferase [Kordiimonadaceae bacterium]
MTDLSGFGALKGLRVIELGQLIAGPFCGQLMADHGAEVIKVEAPEREDPMRHWGQKGPLWWPIISRNKKCITLNLRVKEGQEILKELVRKSDILVENFRPGTMEKWGLGYAELKEINPAIIMVRVSGYGQTGPESKKAGYGSIGEAMGGMRYLAGDPSLPPSRIGLSIGDSLAATYACLGALMALRHRDQTGEGQVVDSAIYEGVLAMMESVVPEYTQADFIRERTGSILPKLAPSNAYPTLDGDLIIGANQDSIFGRLCDAMGCPELAKDPKYIDHYSRGENQAELDDVIADWTSKKSAKEVLTLMEEHGIPAGKIFTTEDMMDNLQYKARESILKVEHEEYDNLYMQNVSPKLSKTPGKIEWAGSTEMGSHNQEVYSSVLGKDDAELSSLKDAGVI